MHQAVKGCNFQKYLFLKVVFVLANIIDPNEMLHYDELLHYAAFHPGTGAA